MYTLMYTEILSLQSLILQGFSAVEKPKGHGFESCHVHQAHKIKVFWVHDVRLFNVH